MSFENIYPIAATSGGGFFASFLIGYFIKKIVKILMFILGGILALLAYLQFQEIIDVTIKLDKIQNSAEAIINTVAANAPLEKKIRDFLNFTISREVLLQHFEAKNNLEDNSESATILFPTSMGENMNKIQVKSPYLFDYRDISGQMDTVLNKWFQIYEETPEILDIYFGVIRYIFWCNVQYSILSNE